MSVVMKRILGAVVYVVLVIASLFLMPNILIPMFQGYGLHPRDVVGFTLVITLISAILLLGLGALIWNLIS